MNNEPYSTIYLAARYGRHAELEGYAQSLRALGFTVSSRWHSGSHAFDEDAGITGEQSLRFAQEDITDLLDAETFVTFTGDGDGATKAPGHHIEFGYALARWAQIIIVGPRESVFHWLPSVWQFDEWGTARTYLEGIASARLPGDQLK